MLGSRDRGAAEALVKFLGRHLRECFEWNRGTGERGVFRDRSPRVPRANILADVAAENMVAYTGMQFVRNRPAQLTCQPSNDGTIA